MKKKMFIVASLALLAMAVTPLTAQRPNVGSAESELSGYQRLPNFGSRFGGARGGAVGGGIVGIARSVSLDEAHNIANADTEIQGFYFQEAGTDGNGHAVFFNQIPEHGEGLPEGFIKVRG